MLCTICLLLLLFIWEPFHPGHLEQFGKRTIKNQIASLIEILLHINDGKQNSSRGHGRRQKNKEIVRI